jgi:predicted transcriptional regulator
MMCHMIGSRKATSIRPPLTELESDVMNAVWAAGACGVEDVHRSISAKHELKEATVRTILRRLEQKGNLTHRLEGRAYIYAPKETASNLAGRAVRQIIDRFCRGSLHELVSGMVDGEMLSDEELAKLEEFARNRKAKA